MTCLNGKCNYVRKEPAGPVMKCADVYTHCTQLRYNACDFYTLSVLHAICARREVIIETRSGFMQRGKDLFDPRSVHTSGI